jgi:hypothetical protein
MRRARLLLALVWVVGACTSTTTSTPPSASSSTSSTVTSTPSPEPVATLGDGTPLPAGCTGKTKASQTVAFVAGGRAWALDPDTLAISCLFETSDPGAFAWGPQGDRVLLGGSQIVGLTKDAPDLPAIGQDPTVLDWGHPLGLAVVFADPAGEPLKRFVDDDSVASLSGLPQGQYLQLAYHPSGLALGFVVERNGRQSIWLSTNEGEDPQRLVFPIGGTEFPSIAFSPDGQKLWWIAEHAAGFPELHWMDLGDRSTFTDTWRGPKGTVATGLKLAPSGQLKAATEGATCATHRALVITGGTARPAMPLESLPTTALGWLDASTLLVAAGCAGPTDLFAVDAHEQGSAPTLLVSGAEIASPRTVLTGAPDFVPAPGSSEPPPGGVG